MACGSAGRCGAGSGRRAPGRRLAARRRSASAAERRADWRSLAISASASSCFSRSSSSACTVPSRSSCRRSVSAAATRSRSASPAASPARSRSRAASARASASEAPMRVSWSPWLSRTRSSSSRSREASSASWSARVPDSSARLSSASARSVAARASARASRSSSSWRARSRPSSARAVARSRSSCWRDSPAARSTGSPVGSGGATTLGAAFAACSALSARSAIDALLPGLWIGAGDSALWRLRVRLPPGGGRSTVSAPTSSSPSPTSSCGPSHGNAAIHVAPSSAFQGLCSSSASSRRRPPPTWTVSTGRTKRRPRTPNQRPSTSSRSSPDHWKRSSSKPVCSGATVLIGCCPRSVP